MCKKREKKNRGKLTFSKGRHRHIELNLIIINIICGLTVNNTLKQGR